MPKTRLFNPGRLFRSILCPVDFSEHSALALRYAAIVAKRSEGQLHVLHVNDPMLATAAAVAFSNQDYAVVVLDELRAFVAEALPAGTMKASSIHCTVETGATVRTIASVAKRLQCNLVVMGTHGLSGVEKLLIGSTTEGLLHRASLPILAIPSSSSEGKPAPEPSRSWPGTAIMAPVDLRDQSAEDVRDAERIARAFGADLVLVHVVPPIQAPPWYRADLSAHARMQVTAAQRQLESLATTIGAGVNAEIRVVAGRPADEIAALAAEERIGLVVMHLRRGPGFLGSRAGSIASHVLHFAVTPVLALPGGAANRLVKTRKGARSPR